MKTILDFCRLFSWKVWSFLAIVIGLLPAVFFAYMSQVYVGFDSTKYLSVNMSSRYASLTLFSIAAISFFLQLKKRALVFTSVDIDSLRRLSWQEFEELTQEMLKMLGYKTKRVGGNGADGGIDILAYKGKFKYIVQCKNWKSTSVGVKVVREMAGVGVHEKADAIYIFTCGSFTAQAIEFAKQKRIYLINGYQICKMVRKLKETK